MPEVAKSDFGNSKKIEIIEKPGYRFYITADSRESLISFFRSVCDKIGYRCTEEEIQPYFGQFTQQTTPLSTYRFYINGKKLTIEACPNPGMDDESQKKYGLMLKEAIESALK